MIRKPRLDTKKWLTSYKGDFWGDIIQNFGIDLFTSQGRIRVGQKFTPLTVGELDTDINLSPVSSFTMARLAVDEENPLKAWGVGEDKVIVRGDDDGFVLDESIGFTDAEETGLLSDLTSVSDETEEPISVVEVAVGTGTGAISITGSGNTEIWAQSFTKVGGPLKKLSLQLRAVGIPTDDFTISIQEDDEGEPDGTPLISYVIDSTTISSSFTNKELEIADFTPDSLQLDTSKIYWIVFERATPDASNYIQVMLNFGGLEEDDDPYKNGTVLSYNGTAWERTVLRTKTDTFTSNDTWTVPTDVTSALVECWAAGAGGSANVGGGGGGSYSRKLLTGLTPSTIYDVVVGGSAINADGGPSGFISPIEYLVIGGGGGGGRQASASGAPGGGGAGAYLAGQIALGIGSYAITVGNGGAGATSNGPGANGGNSSLSNLVVAIGGGGGSNVAGLSGGSGGGAGGTTSSVYDGGTGSTGGNNGGNSFSDATATNCAGGGGGGAGAVGGNGSLAQGGNGGNGIASSITGSSVTRAGGGGGASTTGGTGGTGGGGAGSSGAGPGGSGTANTGSGGGGAISNNGGNGGSGVVIIRYKTSDYTATGGTATTDGSYTIRTFNSSGTFEITAVNSPVIAMGGKSGTNGGTGGSTTNSVGDVKYSGGNGSLGTGDRGGGGGAGDSFAGGKALTEVPGTGGGIQGGSGGGTINSETFDRGGLYGGGGRSSTSSGFNGARGEVRITYNVPVTVDYPYVAERLFGRNTFTSQHQVTVPVTVMTGELLLLVMSFNGNRANSSSSKWTPVKQFASTFNICTQSIYYKYSNGQDSGAINTSVSCNSTYILYRIVNGGTPTATQNTGLGAVNPPEHDTNEFAKYLWITASTIFIDSSGFNSPTDPPSNYNNFITQTELYLTPSFQSARTSVSERLLEAQVENPGSFSGSNENFNVGGTIAIPYREQEYYADITMGIEVEFPTASDRLYLTTSEDVKFLNQEDGIWQSLWQGVYQQDPLEADYPHPMVSAQAGGLLFVGNGNKLISMVATGNIQSLANASRLVFDNDHYINWLVITKNALFIGLANKAGELHDSQICYYEPSSEVTRLFRIPEGQTVGFFHNENCWVLDKAGQLRVYNGSDFRVADYFPTYFTDEDFTLPHRNGIFSRNGIIYFLWEGQYPHAGGVWVYEEGRLYHKHPFVFSPSELSSFGAIDTVAGWGALFPNGNSWYAGVAIYDGALEEVTGIFSNAENETITVEPDKIGVITTPRMVAPERDQIWQRIFAKYNKNNDAQLKFRTRSSDYDETWDAESYTGTWSGQDTFTSATSEFISKVDNGDIQIGDEVTIRKGAGAGLVATIIDISGTAPKTVTVDNPLDNLTGDDMTFSTQHWQEITNGNLVGGQSEWVQVKAVIKDDSELEELQITSDANETNKE